MVSSSHPHLETFGHFSHLNHLESEGSGQNFASVKDDFSDLENIVLYHLKNNAKAQTVAENAVDILRDRFLTLAA